MTDRRDLPTPGRPVVMGVVNVTADSFSDGGRYLDTAAAVDHGLELHRLGVDIVDVGGESTRPGAVRIDPQAEAARVVPVIAALAAAGVAVSVDTMRATVAAAAVEAGASIVNDVSGGRADADMARTIADAGVPWVLMHWRSNRDYVHSGGAATYVDVVADVRRELGEQVDRAVAAGVAPERILVDPGLGFAKNAAHNWALLRGLESLVAWQVPVLVGASRKRFLGELLAAPDGTPRPTAGREIATAVISALAARAGAWGVRVHDVASTLDALAVVRAWNGDAGV